MEMIITEVTVLILTDINSQGLLSLQSFGGNTTGQSLSLFRITPTGIAIARGGVFLCLGSHQLVSQSLGAGYFSLLGVLTQPIARLQSIGVSTQPLTLSHLTKPLDTILLFVLTISCVEITTINRTHHYQ